MLDALIVARVGDTVLVELERAEPGIQLADEQPDGHEIVTVLAEPPVTIVLDDLATLEVEEGTAVLDGTGELVGLCSEGDADDATRLVPVDGETLTADDATGGRTDEPVTRDEVTGERSPAAPPAGATNDG
jgi:hypothetical protein